MTSLYLSANNVTSVITNGAEATRWRLSGSSGSGGKVLNKNTVAGPTAPLLVTDSATTGTDGNTVAWYSDPVLSVTIAGAITASLWGVESLATANAAPCIGIYRCDALGAVLATVTDPATSGSQAALEFGTAAAAKTCTLTAAMVTDTTFNTGERIKVTLCIDDAADQGGSGSMASAKSVQFTIGGLTGQAGQSQIAFTETLLSITQAGSAAVAGRPVNPGREAPVILSGN